MKNQTQSPVAPYFWVPSLYLAQGLPFFAVMHLTQYMLQDRGMAMDDITHWTAAIGLAWVFKPFWSPFIELASSKKKVVVLFELAGGVALGLVAVAMQMPFWFSACIAMLAVVAICSATHVAGPLALMVVTSASVGPNDAWSARRTASACVVGCAAGAVEVGDGPGAGACAGAGPGAGEGAGPGAGAGPCAGAGVAGSAEGVPAVGASACEASLLPLPPHPASAAVNTISAVAACHRERQ